MPSDLPDDLQIILEPVQYPRLDREQLRAVVRDHPAVAAFLDGSPGHRLRISEPDVLGHEPDAHATFEATVFDPASNRAVRVRGRLDRPDELDVQPSGVRPTPSRAELREAAAVLRAQPGFPTGDGVLLYRPMPPLADVHRPDGTVARRPTLGVYDPDGSPRHRVVAVDLAAGTVDWEPRGVDAPTDADCEGRLPVPVDALDDPGGPARVRVRVVRGGVELWDLIVVRPRDSEPQALGKGSGVELRQVRHRGRLVLSRGHVPILNVRYDDGVTFRGWQNAETRFHAAGSDPLGPGFRVCTSPPATILESGDGGTFQGGNFQGVALHYESGELRIVSEVESGSYRYVSDWRLRDDGVIKPRFGFAGTRNPRTCMPHQHHVYWRLDFDIDGCGAEVVDARGPLQPGCPVWTPVVRETSRRRGHAQVSWRVRDKSTGRGYRIVPGVADGTADSYGAGDLWLLRYRRGEYDDGVWAVAGPEAETRARLDGYVTGERIDGADVVVWYAGHFAHDAHAPSAHQGHIIGPELVPLSN